MAILEDHGLKDKNAMTCVYEKLLDVKYKVKKIFIRGDIYANQNKQSYFDNSSNR